MAAISAYAPGKIILLGEHAVVYGRKAIAIPVHQVQARAAVFPLIKDPAGTIRISSPAIHLDTDMSALPKDHPIRRAIELTLAELEIKRVPALQVRISSTIPIAGGMGSGAAVSVVVIRAVSAFLGKSIRNEAVSDIAFEVEKIHHGNPSGIDNTVIAFARPVLYQKGQPIQPFEVGKKLTFLIAGTGIRASTADVLQSVRQSWNDKKEYYEDLFDRIDGLVEQALDSLTVGEEEFIGRWMTENHLLLQQMGVSCPELDNLVDAACTFGAFGAKLSGAGIGGNMIALVPEEKAVPLAEKLKQAGAVQTIITHLEASPCNS
jgi:mevalonate kinase